MTTAMMSVAMVAIMSIIAGASIAAVTDVIFSTEVAFAKYHHAGNDQEYRYQTFIDPREKSRENDKADHR